MQGDTLAPGRIFQESGGSLGEDGYQDSQGRITKEKEEADEEEKKTKNLDASLKSCAYPYPDEKESPGFVVVYVFELNGFSEQRVFVVSVFDIMMNEYEEGEYEAPIGENIVDNIANIVLITVHYRYTRRLFLFACGGAAAGAPPRPRRRIRDGMRGIIGAVICASMAVEQCLKNIGLIFDDAPTALPNVDCKIPRNTVYI